MALRRNDTGSQDSQAAFAPGKTIKNGSLGIQLGPNVETYGLWVPTEMRPAFSEVVHSLMGLAMLFVRRVVALVSLPAKEPYSSFRSSSPTLRGAITISYMQEIRLTRCTLFSASMAGSR